MSDNCECCGKWTTAGEKKLAERAKAHPIFGTDMSIPLSESIELIRIQLSTARGQLGDISSAYPGWGEHLVNIEGLLTCGLIALHDVKEDMLKHEERKKWLAKYKN